MHNNLRAFFLFLTSSSVNVFLSIFVVKLSLKNLLTLDEAIFLRVVIPFVLIFFIKFSTLKEDLVKVNKNNIILLLLLSALSVVDAFSWINAIAIVPINNAVIFSFFVPILTLVASSFINKEKIIFKKKLSICIGFLSVIFSFNFIIEKFNIGYFYLALDITSAVFIIILLKRLQIFSSYFILLTRLSLIIPFSLIRNNFFIKSNFHTLFSSYSNLFYFIIPVLYLIERLSFIKMYKYAEISFVEPLKYLNIVFSSVFGYFLLDQKLTFSQVMCFILIVIANIIGNINFSRFKRFSSSAHKSQK